MFRYYTELGIKWIELVQLMDKFVPLSRIGSFRNERTRSTLLDPKLKYWFVSNCLCALWICFVTAQKSVQNGLNWTLNSCFRVFRSVSVHLAMFNYYTKLGAKWVELVQLMDKFVPLSRIGTFRNERTRSTPLDPKLKYWFVSYCLGALWICFVTARKSVQNGLNWCN